MPLEDFHRLVGMVRGLVAMGKKKIAHLNEIPYLFVRLAEPGVC